MICRFVRTENYLFLIGEKLKSENYPYMVLEFPEPTKPILVKVNSPTDTNDNQYEVLLHKPLGDSDKIQNVEIMNLDL